MAIVSENSVTATLRKYNPWWGGDLSIEETSKLQKRAAFFEAQKMI